MLIVILFLLSLQDNTSLCEEHRVINTLNICSKIYSNKFQYKEGLNFGKKTEGKNESESSK